MPFPWDDDEIKNKSLAQFCMRCETLRKRYSKEAQYCSCIMPPHKCAMRTTDLLSIARHLQVCQTHNTKIAIYMLTEIRTLTEVVIWSGIHINPARHI